MYPIQLVNTFDLLDLCLDDIASPLVFKLAIDLEGIDLSRNGTVALLQILSNISTTVWVIDIFLLGEESFSHISPRGQSLKAVLENRQTIKMLWDVRNDSDALFSLYGISLQTVYDVQLLEVAFRQSRNKYSKTVKGLGTAVQEYVKPDPQWTEVKKAGKALLFPELGGRFELFEERPLESRILAYAANDVSLLFRLGTVLEEGIYGNRVKWKQRVLEASKKRVVESHQAAYDPDGKGRALSPKI